MIRGISEYSGHWFYQLHLMVVRGQPEVDTSCAAEQVGKVLVLTVYQTLQDGLKITLKGQLLREYLSFELPLFLLGLSLLFVVLGLGLLKLALWDEVI